MSRGCLFVSKETLLDFHVESCRITISKETALDESQLILLMTFFVIASRL